MTFGYRKNIKNICNRFKSGGVKDYESKFIH